MANDDGLRLINVSDCHLIATPGERLRGVDTDAMLAAVVDRIVTAEPPPDAVLMTGDLSQDGSAAAYQRARDHFARIGAPEVHCIPGNHDAPAVMAETLAGGPIRLGRVLARDGWQVVFLDSTVPGEDDGFLRDEELAALDAALAARPDAFALVCLHHHPVAVGGAWEDFVSLANAEALFAVLDRHPRVRGLLWGHIHQAYDGFRGDVRLMGTPATCFQFASDGAGGLRVTAGRPGYRRLRLEASGEIATEVVWLDGNAPRR